MIEVKPGVTFTADVDGFDTALVGTLGVTIYQGATIIAARATAGIVESPAGSGAYVATLTAPDDPGDYRLFWDDGAGVSGSDDFLVTSTPGGSVPSDTFASADELAAYLGQTFDSTTTAKAELLLGLATGLIQDELRQTVLRVVDDPLIIPGTPAARIQLPQRPVASVKTVTATYQDSTPYTFPDLSWYVDGGELVRSVYPLGMDRHFLMYGNGWLNPSYTLTITYTHGFASPPTICKTVCLAVSARGLLNPGGVSQESYAGGESRSFFAAGLTLTDYEKDELQRRLGRRLGESRLR